MNDAIDNDFLQKVPADKEYEKFVGSIECDCYNEQLGFFSDYQHYRFLVAVMISRTASLGDEESRELMSCMECIPFAKRFFENPLLLEELCKTLENYCEGQPIQLSNLLWTVIDSLHDVCGQNIDSYQRKKSDQLSEQRIFKQQNELLKYDRCCFEASLRDHQSNYKGRGQGSGVAHLCANCPYWKKKYKGNLRKAAKQLNSIYKKWKERYLGELQPPKPRCAFNCSYCKD